MNHTGKSMIHTKKYETKVLERFFSRKFLFEFYSYKSTPRERATADIERSVEYFLMKARWKQIVEVFDKAEPDTDCILFQLF